MWTTDSQKSDANADTREIVNSLPRLEWRARRLAGDRAAAADLVQDTLEKALRALPRLRPGSNVGAWLDRLLSNTFIDGWRRAGRRGHAVSLERVVAAA